ncbi:arsenical pump-driving ATPase, partial [Halorhodospira abdelmalekii]|uniref:ArsA-related P-loop ATPase n=1 Tax=Halorhodospira abdelmalekii TaxID=421629 RepID=UPI001906E98F
NTSGTSCLGPLEGLAAQKETYAGAVAALADGARTTLVLVSRPEKSALDEASHSSDELRALGVGNQHLVINGLFRASDDSDPVACALEARGQRALAAMPDALAGLPRSERPLRARAPMGLAGLRLLLGSEDAAESCVEEPATTPEAESFERLIDSLERDGRGAVMTLGKGGVGKTTLAARIAVALAARGHSVHLTTTDPAAHVASAVGGELPAGLTIGRIDPRAETERYRADVMATAGADMDAEGRKLLEEDLRSPCTEEIAVFQAFARTVARAEDEIVVLDTAPTGHTILLLDAAQAYHRELGRQSHGVAPEVEQLLPRLRDPHYTRMLLCTLPEATPVHEAAALQADLRRAGIEPAAWIANQSLTPLAVTDPVLRARQVHEARYLREILAEHHNRLVIEPWSEEHS